MDASRPLSDKPLANPAKEAAGWLVRIKSGPLSKLDREHFDKWHRDADNAVAFSQARRIWGAIDEVTFEPEILRARERVVAKIQRRRWIAAVAAGAAVLLVGAVVFTNVAQPLISRLHAWLAPSSLTERGIHSTSIGERSTITLTDGSILTMNTDSAAEVAFDADERKIVLTRGQALFEVAKNRNRPFVVYAGDRKVVATGTAFDVRVDHSQVEITLVEGRVLVGGTPGQRASQAPGHWAELHPGERLISRNGTTVSIAAANVEQITSWTSGQLTFLNSRLDEAIDEVNRYTHSPIVLTDPKLAELRVNGVFRAGQPAEFARAVAQIHRIDIERAADGTILIVARATE